MPRSSPRRRRGRPAARRNPAGDSSAPEVRTDGWPDWLARAVRLQLARSGGDLGATLAQLGEALYGAVAHALFEAGYRLRGGRPGEGFDFYGDDTARATGDLTRLRWWGSWSYDHAPGLAPNAPLRRVGAEVGFVGWSESIDTSAQMDHPRTGKRLGLATVAPREDAAVRAVMRRAIERWFLEVG